MQKKQNANNSGIIQELKSMFPQIPDHQIRKIIKDCDGDLDRVTNWIHTHLENENSKDWNEVGKNAKKQKESKSSKESPTKAPESNRNGQNRSKVSQFNNRPSNSARFVLPKSKHPIAVGPSGKFMQRMSTEFGVKVLIPDKDDSSCVITLVGPQEALEKTKKEIEQATEFPVVFGEIGDLVLDIPKSFHPLIIGKARSNISELEQLCACSVSFPGIDSQSNEVIVHGTKENTLNLKILLEEVYYQEIGPIKIVKLDFQPEPANENAPKSLILNNVAFKATEEGLQNLIQKVTGSTVVAKILKAHETQRSRGLAFVTFENLKDLKNALPILSTTDYMGRSLKFRTADSALVQPKQSKNIEQVHNNGEQNQQSQAPQQSTQHHHQNHLQQHPQLQHHAQSQQPSSHVASNNHATEQLEENEEIQKYVNETIDKLVSVEGFELSSELSGMHLPRAHTVQQYMRYHLRSRLDAQHRRCEETLSINAKNLHLRDDLSKTIQKKENMCHQLHIELQNLKQRLAHEEAELHKVKQEQEKMAKIVELSAQSYGLESHQKRILDAAVRAAETVGQQIETSWVNWMRKLSEQHSFENWNYQDMDTLLECLQINPNIFRHNGIEPTMLGCIDDQLLREMQWNNVVLTFGERRYLLISLRSIVNSARSPLPEHFYTHASVNDVVAYLMSWGLNIHHSGAVSTPPHAPALSKHVIFWSVQDVSAHFKSQGQPEIASGCENARICGAVLLTMNRKECFALLLPTLGETIFMWKEVSTLQKRDLEKRQQQQQQIQPRVKDSSVMSWSIEEVASYFKSQNVPELADICEREGISGAVLLAIEPTDDLTQVEFSKPGDRLKLLLMVKQLSAQ